MRRPVVEARRSERAFRTVLEQKIWERRQTFEEFAEFAEMFAREHREPGSVGVRHLQRLAAGRKPSGEPLSPVRPSTARLLERIFGVGIDVLLGSVREPIEVPEIVGGGSPARADGDLVDALAWLDRRAGWVPGTGRGKVGARAGDLGVGGLLDRNAQRSRVGRAQVASALADYYGPFRAEYGMYRARCGGQSVVTSVVTRVEWLDLAGALTADRDGVRFVAEEFVPGAALSHVGADAVVSRLAESVALGVRIANLPLYRLLGVEVGDALNGTVGRVPFMEYALTMDLLEGELLDAVAAGRSALPLRDLYLPSAESVLDLSKRVCAGGVLALCAIARPGDPFRGGPDYALLVQERSGSVLNASGRLAVIPKAFHQPMSDVRADAQVGATLLRELEEELFGRSDVDMTIGDVRAAVPMHPGRASEPMKWLMAEAGRLRVECTGFGLNLVSGNYEFAGLVVIEDEEFWRRFGGQVEANWEASGLRLYSSLDGELVEELVGQEAWSNEGLFALLQGLRRLSELGGGRVDLPAVEVEVGG